MRSKILIGFFGLDRSAIWTRKSIYRQVFLPLLDRGFEVTIVGHLNHPEKINSQHSDEIDETIRDVPWPFPVEKLLVESQCDDNIADLLPGALCVPWYRRSDESGAMRKNMLHQLHSLRRLYSIIKNEGKIYDAYLILRPDLEYIDEVDLESIKRILTGDVDVIVPCWEEWEGLNDRFAFCNHDKLRALLCRYENLKEFCSERSYIHSEKFLRYCLERSGARVGKTPMRASRVRSNGYTVPENFQMTRIRSDWYKLRGRIRQFYCFWPLGLSLSRNFKR